MANQCPLISVICCAHNEEEYVGKSIPAILRALEGLSSEVLFVADRCTDNTIDIVRRYNVTLIDKKWKAWENSYAESLQTGYLKAKGKYVSIVDADIAVPLNFFSALLPIIKNSVASVAAEVVTYPDTLWNRLFYAWEKTRNLSPLGNEPRGATRIVLKSALDEMDGFHDVPAPDTDLDLHLDNKGLKSVPVSTVKAYHLRHLTFGKMVSGQVASGRARYILGVSKKRTLCHSVLRIRPLVLQGWLLEWMNRKTSQKETCKKKFVSNLHE